MWKLTDKSDSQIVFRKQFHPCCLLIYSSNQSVMFQFPNSASRMTSSLGNNIKLNEPYISNYIVTHLAIAKKASSTLRPLFADVSMNVTLYSLASLSPSSLLTTLSEPQSHLFPTKRNTHNHSPLGKESPGHCVLNNYIHHSPERFH